MASVEINILYRSLSFSLSHLLLLDTFRGFVGASVVVLLGLPEVDLFAARLARAEDAFEDEEFVAVDALVPVHVEHVEGDLEAGPRLRQHAKQEQILGDGNDALRGLREQGAERKGKSREGKRREGKRREGIEGYAIGAVSTSGQTRAACERCIRCCPVV